MKWYSEEQLARRTLTFRNGLVYLGNSSKPFSTDSVVQRTGLALRSAFSDAKWIYIMRPDGKIIVSPSILEIKHNSLANSVSAAGHIEIVNGVITYADNRSGHFMPSPISLGRLLFEIDRNGGDITSIRLEALGL